MQLINECEKLCKYQTVRVGGIFGGANITTQRQLLFNGLDVLVATPGRLLDMILDRALIVTSLQKLIIDEVDDMLSLGFRPQLIKVLELLPLKRQNILFSATLTEEIEIIINQFFKSPNYIEVNTRGTPKPSPETLAEGPEIDANDAKVRALGLLRQSNEIMRMEGGRR